MSRYKVHKLELVMTDTFVLASGVPDETPTHPAEMARCAQDLVQAFRAHVFLRKVAVKVKLGIHTGEIGVFWGLEGWTWARGTEPRREHGMR